MKLCVNKSISWKELIMNKNENELKSKKVLNEIKKRNKKISKKKNISKIEKTYIKKQNIRKYYEDNVSLISDDELVKIYDKIFKPDILVELTIGVTAGLISSFLAADFDLHWLLPDNISNITIGHIFAFVIICLLITIFIVFPAVFLVIFAYRNIASLRSYHDEIDDYHREILRKYISEREMTYHKKDEDQQGHKNQKLEHKKQ